MRVVKFIVRQSSYTSQEASHNKLKEINWNIEKKFFNFSFPDPADGDSLCHHSLHVFSSQCRGLQVSVQMNIIHEQVFGFSESLC